MSYNCSTLETYISADCRSVEYVQDDEYGEVVLIDHEDWLKFVRKYNNKDNIEYKVNNSKNNKKIIKTK